MMPCLEKSRLLMEYEAATTKFASTVTELQRRMGTSPKAEYDRLQRVADEARVKSEQCERTNYWIKIDSTRTAGFVTVSMSSFSR